MCTQRRRVSLLLLALACGFAGSRAAADGTFGMVSGTVADEFGGVLPGARVTLVEEQTLDVRDTTSDASGRFRFQGLPPGGYVIKVELPGFRTLEWRGNPVGAGSHLAFGTLALTVGAGETYVDSGAKVDTEDSQRVAAITPAQIEPIASRPGDLTTLMRLLPGVRYEDSLEVIGGAFGAEVPNVDGQRRSWNQITVDGVNANELGTTSRFATATALGAVAEIRIFSSGYQAEMGRTGGANIRVVTKSGGTRYTLSPYWEERRSTWAARRWTPGGLDPLPRAKSHFRKMGVNVGGPLELPGRGSDSEEKKLFFFYSGEAVESKQPGPTRYYLVPTEAERRGDFSATRSAFQVPIVILDPLTGNPFPGNIVPAHRIDPSGQALLNRLPLPTHNGGWGGNNLVTRGENRSTRFNHVLRLDWKPSAHDRLFVSLNTFDSAQKGSEITAGPTDWGFFDGSYDFGNQALSAGHTHVFGVHAVNDLNVGARRQTEGFGWATEADRRRTDRAAVGWRNGQFHPQLNTPDVIPRAFFGVGSGASLSPDFLFDHRLGESNRDLIFSLRDDLTWSRGRHTFKAGLYGERLMNDEARGGLWMGEYDFSSSSVNPLNTGFAYANALLGVFRQYEEWDAYRKPRNRSWLAEAYVQDTWKAHARLTLDYGVRLLWYTPLYQADERTAAFVLERYDPARAPRLYRPVRVGNTVYAEDPLTGARVSPAYVGAYVPGSGDPTNGIVAASDPTYPRGFRDNQGLHPEPRVGFAYDLFGDRRTALRASAGLFHQARLGGGSQGNLWAPPSITRGMLLSGTTAGLFDGPGLANRPSAVNGIERDAKTPSAYKLSVGVQRDLGQGLVADVAYVGALGRHLEIQRDINAVPDGARFLDLHPENRDPRYNGPLTPTFAGPALPSEFLRPYPGWQSILIRENWGTSNYNALQVALSRRYMKGLQFSVAYTLSKALGITDEDPGSAATIEEYRPLKEWHYAPAGHNQRHAFVGTFTWDLPKLGGFAGGSAFARRVLDGWQVSGEYAWVSGDRAGITLLTTDGFDFDGGDNTSRPRMLRDPMEDVGGDALFDTSAFARPSGRGDYGNTPRNAVQLPGIDNLNLSLLKTLKLHKRLGMQVRVDAWNALNHTQFSDVDRAARFHHAAPYYAQVNPTFGKPTAARRPREIQLSARFKLF